MRVDGHNIDTYNRIHQNDTLDPNNADFGNVVISPVGPYRPPQVPNNLSLMSSIFRLLSGGPTWDPFWRLLETPATAEQAAWTDKGKWPTIALTIPVLAPFAAGEVGLLAALESLPEISLTTIRTSLAAGRINAAIQFGNIGVQSAEISEGVLPMAEILEPSAIGEAEAAASETFIQTSGQGFPPFGW